MIQGLTLHAITQSVWLFEGPPKRLSLSSGMNSKKGSQADDLLTKERVESTNDQHLDPSRLQAVRAQQALPEITSKPQSDLAHEPKWQT